MKAKKFPEVIDRIFVVCQAVDIRECKGCIFLDHPKVECSSGLEELKELLEVKQEGSPYSQRLNDLLEEKFTGF